MDPEQEFLAHLDLIEEVSRFVTRQRGLVGGDAEDFASYVKVKLIEDDYAVFRKFEGRARLRTYLTTVINRLGYDYRREQQGKWRPSAAAQRLGPLAVRLEELIYRDGSSYPEATQRLLGELPGEVSEEELYDLAAQLPARRQRRIEGGEALEAATETAGEAAFRRVRGERRPLPPATAEAQRQLEERETRSQRRRILETLAGARAGLDGEDVLLLRLRYEEGFKVVEIAAATGQDRATLYRRLRRLKKVLRRHLEARGIEAKDLRDLFT